MVVASTSSASGGGGVTDLGLAMWYCLLHSARFSSVQFDSARFGLVWFVLPFIFPPSDPREASRHLAGKLASKTERARAGCQGCCVGKGHPMATRHECKKKPERQRTGEQEQASRLDRTWKAKCPEPKSETETPELKPEAP